MSHNRTAYVILGGLSIQSNLSGYELHKAIEENFGSFWGESYGQIYPTLKRLAAEGLIVPSNSISASRKRRQQYSLTDAGRACLREWLALPFQNDPPRNEFLLKLFFGREAAPGVALTHVRELQERNRRMLAGLEGIDKMARANQPRDPNMPYWMLTLGLGIALTRAALDWGESALAQLSSLQQVAAHGAQPAGEGPAEDKG
ncbi:MAG: PadR family transcriptional regulator [Terracidiphilus sp.]|nr:PadR family transcriptional regulator [Terracidiphilus sp.]